MSSPPGGVRPSPPAGGAPGPSPAYRTVDPQVSFPELEGRILDRWRREETYRRSLEQRAGAPEWVFYEGPPTANGRPAIHHVEARVFKDLFCRFQSMTGHYVHRKAGWDCHGLPVEIEVEKELGITQKRQIEEEMGIEEFTRRCRASVERYVDDWERLTARIGFWLDLGDAYWTMSPEYVESVWWILKQIWDKGLLEEDFKVVPYCPRCETALSNHEQHQPGAYRTVTDPSVYVRFPLVDDPDTALLVWTTTPWTLLSNMAAAAGSEIGYVKVADPGLPGRYLILARDRVAALLGEDTQVVQEMHGADLLGRRYEPPFGFVDPSEAGHRVRPGDFVTTEDGSGLVHLAPYGEADMEVAKRDRLPIVQMIDGSGRVAPHGGAFAGLWIKDADPLIVEDLERRGLLFRSENYEHSYPHCWRCRTPLIYFARKDWYIRTSQIRRELEASNEETNWQPPTIKHGRFGDWLANNVDWSLSRDRYWGTPLPIWRCTQEHATCIGSFAELAELSGRELGAAFDPHRPYVDDIVLPCPQCGAEARRVSSVIDTWFDSGAMPFAQWHYPFENEELFEKRFPADFISEAIDQTRGWFYTLLAIGTLVRGQSSYRNVVCLGLIVDADGRKMSKSLGNAVDPWEVLNEQGADALRWYMLTSGTPWSPRRLSAGLIQESVRKYLLTLWNTYSFWVTYASLEGFDPQATSIPVSERPEMDRWVLAELDDTVREMTAALDGFDATRAGRRLDRFVDDLSNWYVRRSRRRFWRSAQESDTRSAFLTLWECLTTTAELSAPFTPFVAEEIHGNLMGPGSPSVHLEDWPVPDGTRVDDGLRARMALVRKLVALGRAARTDAGIRVRQPLARALVVVRAAEAAELMGLEDIVKDELNVRELEVTKGLDELVTYSVKVNFKQLGPRFGPRVKEVARAVAAAEARALVAALESEDGAALTLDDGETIRLSAADLEVRVEGRQGYSLAQEGPHGVALDLDITPDLAAEGVAREAVRAIQELRRSSGLAVEDRIEVWLSSASDVAAGALGTHEAFISEEVLSVRTRLQEVPPDEVERHEVTLGEHPAVVALRRA
ncbi:MAG: isoleucine--tRNA ligase [Actinomycetota bacterium]